MPGVLRSSGAPWRWVGIFRSKFDAGVLEAKLEQALGDMRLDDPRMRTLLAIVTKRLDTGSPRWIISNNPASPWWDGAEPERRNRTFRVADLIRASTAAPTIFAPKRLPIGPGLPYGTFVDGAISPFNSPALALLMMARLDGHGLKWPTGPDRLRIVSVGTGIWREPVYYGLWQKLVVALFGARALQGITLVLTELSDRMNNTDNQFNNRTLPVSSYPREQMAITPARSAGNLLPNAF